MALIFLLQIRFCQKSCTQKKFMSTDKRNPLLSLVFPTSYLYKLSDYCSQTKHSLPDQGFSQPYHNVIQGNICKGFSSLGVLYDLHTSKHVLTWESSYNMADLHKAALVVELWRWLGCSCSRVQVNRTTNHLELSVQLVFWSQMKLLS